MIANVAIFLVALALAMQGDDAAAQDTKLCDVVIDESGSTQRVPCCDLTDRVFTGNPASTVTLEADTKFNEDCADVTSAAELKAVETLHGVIRKQTANTIAKFLRRNVGTGIGGFTIEQPFYTFTQFCCTCVPGETCSVQFFWEVCTYTNNGMCPSGTIRTVCTYGDKYPAACTGID